MGLENGGGSLGSAADTNGYPSSSLKRRSMKILPRLAALFGSGAVLAGLFAGAAPAPTASAELIQDGVYSVSYTGDLFLVDNESDGVYQLTYADWRDLGFPAPQRIGTDWVKYPWSPTIYAVTFFGTDRSEWLWDQVTYDEWRRAGFPAARSAGWIEGSEYYKWGTADELFVAGPDDSTHKLTGRQWADAGYPAPEDVANQGFIKYSWNPTIVFMNDLAGGQGQAISYAEWRDEDFPTPRTVTRVTGDQVYQNYGSADIWYAGPGLNKRLTAAEWRAMGSPTPTINGAPTAPPRPTNMKNCGDFPSRAAAQREFDQLYPYYGDIYKLDRDGDRKVCEVYKY